MKLASIETISEVTPHPNADRLEVAKVLGWQTVIRKGEFKAGDNAVFVVIDTILPRAPWSEFLVDQKRPDKPIRLNTVKLRGQHSQGLLLPLSVLPNGSQRWHVGADVGGELGIKKYEKEIPAQLSGVARSSFPQHLAPRTDEDNGLSNPDIVAETLRHSVMATVKLDGSSCTVIVKGGKISEVCSRNLSIVEDDKNAFWKAARKLDKFIDSLNVQGDSDTVVVQGELMGPGIQGNQLGLAEPTLYVFQVKFDGTWAYRDILEDIGEDYGFNVVPSVAITKDPVTLEDWQLVADSQTLPNGQPAEGIVVRAEPPISMGNGRPLGFKIINRNYKEA